MSDIIKHPDENGERLEQLCCRSCNEWFNKKELDVYCSNCFGCTGCERYVCPLCEGEIVVKPIRKLGQSE